MKTYESEKGFYSLSYPGNFELTKNDNIVNIGALDGKSSITISSFHFDKGVDDHRFNEMWNLFTKDLISTTEKFELSADISIQRFTEKTEIGLAIWTKCLNRNAKVLLAMSIYFLENERDEVIDQYQAILNSIENRDAIICEEHA